MASRSNQSFNHFSPSTTHSSHSEYYANFLKQLYACAGKEKWSPAKVKQMINNP
jgi:hypothetical protein